MRKGKFITFALIAVFSVALVYAGSSKKAEATPVFNFTGNYQLADSANPTGVVGNGDGFNDTISFMNANIGSFGPASDSLFMDAGDTNLGGTGFNNAGGYETVSIAPLTFDQSSFSANNYFDFVGSPYSQAFKVFDDNGAELLVADLTVNRLDITGTSVGSINSTFGMNLTNIVAGSGYNPTSAANTSVIVESFLNSNQSGAVSISLQFAGDLSAAIYDPNGVGTSHGSYSGSAAPVPEPGTIALLGIGLAGLVGVGVRKRAKKEAA
ncbi:MAG: PEP-CTERM sorting domain-containing protein [Psychromonas sp.]|nr:PEP-CTERM sorting domain-containing protein [Psychromonas sp.]